jgi:hypothetical protein
MRCLPGLVLLMLTATSLTATAQTTTQASAPKRTVYLTGMALEELKSSNPAHYSRALKVMDEMSKPCPEGEWQSRPIQQGPSPPKCSAFFLQTSNPPKRQITFVLDDTLYIANVVMKQSDVRARRLDPAPGEFKQ